MSTLEKFILFPRYTPYSLYGERYEYKKKKSARGDGQLPVLAV
jgi:hypothetical protein